MKTLILEQPGVLRVGERPRPGVLAAGEARVRVRCSGVCGTDLHAFAGRQPFFTYPRVLRHELAVEVVEVAADVTTVRVGERCSVEPYLNCGHCVACRRGRPNCCETLRVLGVHVDGGWTEEIVVPAHKLHASARLADEQLALVETLGIGAHAVARGAPERGETVVVVGAGPIGLAVAQFAVAAGARVTVLDVSAMRRTFVREWLGVATIEARELTPEILRERLGGELPTLVFDATGSAAAMRQSFAWPAAGGRIVFVGLVQGEIAFDDPAFHRRELTVFASRNSTPADFRRIITMMEAGEIDTRPWVTHRARVDEVPRVFAEWARLESGVIKAMIEL
jgi:2-desacetyl-2-hydroxyethyl bacteriochlorophyllide A dehydrogenase